MNYSSAAEEKSLLDRFTALLHWSDSSWIKETMVDLPQMLPLAPSKPLQPLPRTQRFVYICLQLKNESLTNGTRTRLEQIGVSCLEEGGAFQAYGVIDLNALSFAALEAAEGVLSLALAEPPSGK